MANLNKVQIIGRITKDIELKYTQSNKAVCNLSIATNEKRKDLDGNVQETSEFHSIVCWDKQAELAAKYLAKGREVYIEGKLTTRKWEDQNGQTRYTTEIVSRDMQFIGGNPNQGQQSTSNQQGQQQQRQQNNFTPNQQAANDFDRQQQRQQNHQQQNQADNGGGFPQQNNQGFAGPNNNNQMQQGQGQSQGDNFSNIPF